MLTALHLSALVLCRTRRGTAGTNICFWRLQRGHRPWTCWQSTASAAATAGALLSFMQSSRFLASQLSALLHRCKHHSGCIVDHSESACEMGACQWSLVEATACSPGRHDRPCPCSSYLLHLHTGCMELSQWHGPSLMSSCVLQISGHTTGSQRFVHMTGNPQQMRAAQEHAEASNRYSGAPRGQMGPGNTGLGLAQMPQAAQLQHMGQQHHHPGGPQQQAHLQHLQGRGGNRQPTPKSSNGPRGPQVLSLWQIPCESGKSPAGLQTEQFDCSRMLQRQLLSASGRLSWETSRRTLQSLI